MSHSTFPAAWLEITGVMSAAPHLALLEEVNRYKVAHDDIAAVTVIWRSMNLKAQIRLDELAARGKARRAEAKADSAEAAAILARCPGLRWEKR